jgi:hypothetical protein
MFITKKHIPRRTFLRGMGVTLALPLLDAMLPAQTPLARTAASPKTRVGFIFIPHGASMSYWTPASEGANFQLTPILSPLEPYRDRLTIVSGTAHRMADAQPGEKGGDHATPAAVFLSGSHPRRTTGQDVRLGTTVDQVLAKQIGQDTPLPSLELGIEDVGATGTCGSGYSCAYSNTISWETPTKPLPVEIRPQVVFERLFGDGSTPEARTARKQQDRSILDSITHDVAKLRQNVGPSDARRLDQYLDDVREIERRLVMAERQASVAAAESVPATPVGVPESFEEHVRLMFDLMTLAFKSEITRVSSIMLGRELSVRSFPESGFNGGWHGTSHHGDNPVRLESWSKINRYHVQVLTHFIERLQSTPDGDGNLLDHSMILYGSGMSNGNQHNHYPLPVVLIGGGSGHLRGGRHIKADQSPMSNVLLAMLDKAGVQLDSFGDSTGKIDI